MKLTVDPCYINTTLPGLLVVIVLSPKIFPFRGSHQGELKKFPCKSPLIREINRGGRIFPVFHLSYFAIMCQRPKKEISYTTLEADNTMKSRRLTSSSGPSYSFSPWFPSPPPLWKPVRFPSAWTQLISNLEPRQPPSSQGEGVGPLPWAEFKASLRKESRRVQGYNWYHLKHS